MIFVTANLHVVSQRQLQAVKRISKFVKKRFRKRPTAIGGQEVLQAQGKKRVGLLWRVYQTNHRDPQGRYDKHLNDNVVFVRSHLRKIGVQWFQGAKPWVKLNHNGRSINVSTFKHGKHIVDVIDTHLPVVAHDVHTHAPLPLLHEPDKGYAKMAVQVADLADELRKQGHLVVITCDSNVDNAWAYALMNVLRQRGYTVVNNKIDFVGFHSSQARCVDHAVIPKEVLFSDHDGLAVEVEVII